MANAVFVGGTQNGKCFELPMLPTVYQFATKRMRRTVEFLDTDPIEFEPLELETYDLHLVGGGHFYVCRVETKPEERAGGREAPLPGRYALGGRPVGLQLAEQ